MSTRPYSTISLDTETTGLDIRHGCRPFMVQVCDQDGRQLCWEWEVDPFTREPQFDYNDLEHIQTVINDADKIIFHNAKFDLCGLEHIGITWPEEYWDKVEDTLVASHIINSSGSHKLKDLCILHCDILDDDEEELKKAVNKSRLYGKKMGWRIAAKNDPHWPAQKSLGKMRDVKNSYASADYWLPFVAAKHQNLPENHPWYHLTRTYANRDTARTIQLWWVYEQMLKENGKPFGSDYEKVYRLRMDTLRALYSMENNGFTGKTLPSRKIARQYHQRAAETKQQLIKTGTVFMPDFNPDKPIHVQKLLFNHLHCPATKAKKNGYSTESNDLEDLITDELKSRMPDLCKTINSLIYYRKQSKAANYVDSYVLGGFPEDVSFYRLHPNIFLTGTDTTRQSMSNPNGQNIGEKDGYNLRTIFGPGPKRIWFSADFSNIELRIFAWGSQDQGLIDAFLSGASVHLIFCEVLHPELMAECRAKGLDFKEVYNKTWYQWVKNGNFSLIYGASEKKADATYRVKGAYRKIRSSLPLIDAFMSAKNREALKYGKVHTLLGYPLQVSSNEPHKAVNYYVQGSAGLAMGLAINRIHRYLRGLGADWKMVLTIHDELVFDFPDVPFANEVMHQCHKLMEQSGDDLGLPLPVDVKVIRDNWGTEAKWKYQPKKWKPFLPKGLAA